MKPPVRRATAAAVLLAASVGGGVFAQQELGGPAQPPPPVSPDEIAKLPRLDPNEMLATSGERIAFISSQVGEVKQRLALAQKEKDILRFNCLNEIATRLKGYFAEAEQRMQRIRDAVTRLAHDEMHQLYAEVLVLTQKAEFLAGEARSCAGASDVVGQTTVEVVRPTGGPNDQPGAIDPTRPPPAQGPLSRPPAVSPWK